VHCESRVAVPVGTGQFGDLEKGISAVRRQYQRTGEVTADWENPMSA
jgi:hypothetical protein